MAMPGAPKEAENMEARAYGALIQKYLLHQTFERLGYQNNYL